MTDILSASHTRNKSQLSSYVDPAIRQRLLTEARPYMKADKKCEEIWKAICKANQFSKTGILDDVGISILWEKQ